jgi:hypothetical protein
MTSANRLPPSSRLTSPRERLRVLVLTNEHKDGDHPGHRDAFAVLEQDGSIAMSSWAAPNMIAKSKGHEGALREIVEIIQGVRPDVVVVFTMQGFPFDEDWFRAVAAMTSRPVLLYVEQDAWGRWSKPVPYETRLWWRKADVIFSVAVGSQRRLIERVGGNDVRHIANTYDHVEFANEELRPPAIRGDFREVVTIGNRWGGAYFARLPGARQRAKLVRDLQRDAAIPLAVYGRGWTGRGVRGPIIHDDQAATARSGLITVNWDHFPKHAGYASNRLSVHLLAGRAHVTTLHPESDWLPGPDHGLFLERSVGDVIARVRELLARPREEVLELGAAAHLWARHRVSDRELARYVLGAVDERLLHGLPDSPWGRLPR